MSSDKIYALLDTIETDDKEDIENLLNDWTPNLLTSC